jgi:bacterial/archaeal transporter family protein
MPFTQTWFLYAVAAAVCAALINVLAKLGMKDVDKDLATAVRSIVQAVFVVGFAAIVGVLRNVGQIHGKAIVSIVLSGVCGGLSWIFVFRAIQLADVSKIAPIDKLSMPLGIILAVIILKERPTAINWFGILLITFGAYLASMTSKPH